MGMHSARRTGSMTTVAGRGLFTATAAFALIGGGTGMAFAGEAPSSHGHESSHGEDAGHGSGHGSEHGSGHGSEHQNDCEIPVVDDGSETVDATVNGLTGGATAQALEAGNEAVAPVHDAICPSAGEILDPLTGQLPSAGDEEGATSEEPASDEATSEEPEGTEPAGSPSTPTITDIPAMAPTAS